VPTVVIHSKHATRLLNHALPTGPAKPRHRVRGQSHGDAAALETSGKADPGRLEELQRKHARLDPFALSAPIEAKLRRIFARRPETRPLALGPQRLERDFTVLTSIAPGATQAPPGPGRGRSAG